MNAREAVKWVVQKSTVALLAGVLTLGVFLILPLMQTIGQGGGTDSMVRPVDIAQIAPPPPPPVEEEPEEEEQEEEPPPQLTPEAPPLDLSQLELALNPGSGDGLMGDFAVKLTGDFSAGGGEEMDKIFSMAELDQRPQVIFQRSPTYPSELRKRKRKGTVYVVFQVDTRGRVSNAKIDKSTDGAFEDSALEAVKQWRFEPGTRNGEKVAFKMRVPITFNAS